MSERYTPTSDTYSFRTNWFEINARAYWDYLIPALENLNSYLEIGCFEGNSACYIADHARGDLHMTFLDSWEGAPGVIPAHLDMETAEKNFIANIDKAIDNSPYLVTKRVLKKKSDKGLAQLFLEEQQYDLVYVDANHEGWLALYDAVLAYRLCKIGGTLIFDDYTPFYNDVGDPDSTHSLSYTQNCKEAIDAFVNLHIGRLNILTTPLRQFVVQKIA
jgi:predicted O-methyltransferase YrrM